MLIPLRDRIPTQSRPYVTWALIAANMLLFVWYGTPFGEPLFGSSISIQEAWDGWSLRRVYDNSLTGWTGFVSHMFLHGDLLHLLTNMIVLYIVGDNLEDALGHFIFLAYYLACGLCGAFLYVLPLEDLWSIAGGASGAVAGLVAGYVLLLPRSRIELLLLLPNPVWPFSILLMFIWRRRRWGYWPILFVRFALPAWILLGVMLAIDLNGALSESMTSQTAHWIHIGGFISGMLLLLPYRRRLRRRALRSSRQQAMRKVEVTSPWKRVVPLQAPVPDTQEPYEDGQRQIWRRRSASEEPIENRPSVTRMRR